MYFHPTMAGEDRQALFPSDEHRVAAARAIARTCGSECALFCAADDHVHLLVRGEPRRVGQLVGNVSQALARIADAPLEAARIRPITSRNHLENVVPYILGQTTHHELATSEHPALWLGSAFVDVVGARILPGFTPQCLREALPRLTSARVWGAVGLEPVAPAADDRLAALGFDALFDAARVAAGRTDLAGRPAFLARSTLVQLAVRIGLPPRRLADALALPIRTIHYLASAPPDATFERAVRLAAAIRDTVRSAPGGATAAGPAPRRGTS